MARNYRDGPKWMVGVVVERKGPLSYVVQVNHGMLWRRHVDQLRNGPRTEPQTEMWRFPLVLSQKRGRKNKCKKPRMMNLNHLKMLPHKQKTALSQYKKLLKAMPGGTPHESGNPLKGTSN